MPQFMRSPSRLCLWKPEQSAQNTLQRLRGFPDNDIHKKLLSSKQAFSVCSRRSRMRSEEMPQGTSAHPSEKSPQSGSRSPKPRLRSPKNSCLHHAETHDAPPFSDLLYGSRDVRCAQKNHRGQTVTLCDFAYFFFSCHSCTPLSSSCSRR